MGHRKGKPYCGRHDRELEWIMPFRTLVICRDKADESDIGHIQNVYDESVIWYEQEELDISDNVPEPDEQGRHPKPPKRRQPDEADKGRKRTKADIAAIRDEKDERRKPAISANVHIWDAEDIKVKRLEPPISDDPNIWVITVNDSIKLYLHNEEVKNILMTKLWEES